MTVIQFTHWNAVHRNYEEKDRCILHKWIFFVHTADAMRLSKEASIPAAVAQLYQPKFSTTNNSCVFSFWTWDALTDLFDHRGAYPTNERVQKIKQGVETYLDWDTWKVWGDWTRVILMSLSLIGFEFSLFFCPVCQRKREQKDRKEGILCERV